MKLIAYIASVFLFFNLMASETNTLKKVIQKEDVEELSVELKMSKGDFTITTDDIGKRLFSGDFYFEKNKPIIEFNKKGQLANLEIFADTENSTDFSKSQIKKSIKINTLKIVEENVWTLNFNSHVILNIKSETGGAKSSFKFDKVKLRQLELDAGATELFLDFHHQNSIEMEALTINSGASKINCINLANSRAKMITIESGVGTCSLDFAGELSNDMEVYVENGVGKVAIYLPRDTGVRIKVNSSFFSSFSCDEYKKENGYYVSDSYGDSKYKINFVIDNSLGKVEINPKD